MADMGLDRQFHCLRVQLFRGRRPPNPARIFAARVICDRLSLCSRAARKQIAQSLRELAHVVLVKLGAPQCGPFSGAQPRRLVDEALALGLLQGGFLDQKALPFVAPARPTEADDDRRQR